jgi:hypothetical protein
VSWHVLVKDRLFDNSLLNFDKPRPFYLDFRFYILDWEWVMSNGASGPMLYIPFSTIFS